jgi:uncharacterized membrane-anchored protein
MKLPKDHDLRRGLNDEVHARPPQPLKSPCRILYLAIIVDPTQRAADWSNLAKYCSERKVAPPSETSNHFTGDFGGYRLKWERHTEFSRYKIIEPSDDRPPFSPLRSLGAAQPLFDGLAGTTLIATQAELIPADAAPANVEDVSDLYFDGRPIIGSSISGGAAIGLTDFRIGDDGLSRMLVIDHGLQPRQAGRVIQRILEIDTYRMMALLTLPIANGLRPFLASREKELASITSTMTEGGLVEEQNLLERLTTLEAAIERRLAENHARFSASSAYYDLVRQRIGELKEKKLPGLQTFQEFMERRLQPAMSTCQSTAARIETLSERVSRSSQLLSTRVAIERERQNQLLLEATARRAELQLRLQQTVEGLSVAAITYYIVGLIGYLAKGLKTQLGGIDPELTMAISIPLVALAVAFGLHSVRRTLQTTRKE